MSVFALLQISFSSLKSDWSTGISLKFADCIKVLGFRKY